MDHEIDFSNLEITPEMVGIHSINPFIGNNSSSRQVMFSNHIGQAISLINGEERLIVTGTETILGKHVADIRVPEDCMVYKIIPKFRRSYTNKDIANTDVYIIYESLDTGKYGVIEVPNYNSFHSVFGYNLDYTDEFYNIHPKVLLEKDTVLARPKTIKENGGYCFGVNLNVAYMSIKEVSEDGFVVSESTLRKLEFDIFERKSIQIGKETIPLNLYGNDEIYKIFPDIGEYIRDDGILLAIRKFDPLYTMPKLTRKSLQKVDFINDKVYCVKRGQVIDINIHWNLVNKNHVFNKIRDQLEYYGNLKHQFYKEILRTYKDIKQTKYKKDSIVPLTPELSDLIKDAIVTVGREEGFKFVPERIHKVFKLEPIEEFKVDFTIRTRLRPTIGYKLTDLHGGKGVIVKILPDNEMPLDRYGKRADIIVDPNSVVSRMNLGRLYEQYYSDAIVRTTSIIRSKVKNKTHNEIKSAFEILLGFLYIVSPVMYNEYRELVAKAGDDGISIMEDIITNILEDKLQIFIPVDGKRRDDLIVKEIENSIYKPEIGPVRMVVNGKEIFTKDPVRIAPQYFMLLEKIASQWLAVSTVHLNHFNVPTSIPKVLRDRMVYRDSAVKFVGEMEARILASYTPPKVLAELMDRNASVRTHMEVYKRLLVDEYPTDIDEIIDRDIIPYYSELHPDYGTAPMQLVYHISKCAGFNFKYNKGE